MNALVVAGIVWLGMLRRKDIYVLAVLLAALLVALVSLNVFGLGGAVGYVKDVGLVMAWLFSWILAVAVAARELPQEESKGTIFPLLAKPITRLDIVLGKWLGAWGIVSGATLAFYLLIAGVAALKGGAFSPAVAAQAYVLHAIALGLIAAIAILFSTRLNADAAATLAYVFTGAAALLVPRVPHLLVYRSGVRDAAMLLLYHLLPHFELFDMRKRLVHDYGVTGWGTFGVVALYGALWILLVLLLAWMAYRRKRFSRGSLL